VRLLSVGSLPPAWGGPLHGGVATLHATLLEGFLDPECPVETVGVLSPVPIGRKTPVPVFSRAENDTATSFYERLLERLEPEVVLMHHFAHQIGVAHARMNAPPPAVGVAHSWHSITFSSGEARAEARARAEEALGGLRALVSMSRHCVSEGEELGLSYPSVVETIYHPLQPLYSRDDLNLSEDRSGRTGIAYLGSLIPRKNPEALVEAAAAIPELDVVLAGHGELEGNLRDLITSLSVGNRVGIRHLNDVQVRNLLLRSEAMCLPSRSETFGLAYIEALACGTPVVGFGPTLREIDEEMGVEIGEALDSSDSEEVAAAIERVREATWDRPLLRRRTLEAFSLRGATDRYVDLLRRVVG